MRLPPKSKTAGTLPIKAVSPGGEIRVPYAVVTTFYAILESRSTTIFPPKARLGDQVAVGFYLLARLNLQTQTHRPDL